MSVRIKTFYIDKLDQGVLSEVTSVLRDEIGVEGDFIEGISLVSYSDSILQLSITYRKSHDRAILTTHPYPGSIIYSGATLDHVTVLFPHPVDTIDTSSIYIDGAPVDSVYKESDYVVRATKAALDASGAHSIEIKSDLITYTDGTSPRSSDYIPYNMYETTVYYRGQDFFYGQTIGRRGDVVVEGLKIDKSVVPSDRLESYLDEIGISQDRLIKVDAVDISPDLTYLAVAYFSTLEPRPIAVYPFHGSSPIRNALPDKIAIIFSDPVDEHYITNTDGVFYIASGLSSKTDILSADVSVGSDGRTVYISTASYITSESVYDFRIGDVVAADGTKSTRHYVYSLQVNGAVPSVSDPIKPGGGLYYSAPDEISVGSADPTIVIGTDDIKVGTIDGVNINAGQVSGDHIAAGQVVKSINTLQDDITIDGKGRTTIDTAGSTISVSGKSISGVSGVELDDSSSSVTKLFVKGGDSTISISAGGVTVGTITAGNIAAGEVVKDINTLKDSVSLVAAGRTNISVSAPNITVSGKSLSGASGINIDDTADPTQLSVKAADGTISIGADGVSVGTINETNIAAGQVVKDINSLKDSITLAGKGRSSISSSSNTIYVSGKSLSGVSGVEINDSTDPTQLSVKASDGTISISTDGVSVGTINGSNIAAGQVVKDLNTLTDSISLVPDGRVSINTSAPSITVSGKSLTGLSGVEIDDTTDPTKLFVKAADGTISIGIGGVSVGTINESNIAAGQVVKDLNGLKDSITIGGKGRSSISVDGSTIYVSGKSLSGVSGVEIDDALDPTQLSVKSADATISISAGGVSVGTIGAGNIGAGEVVKDLNGLKDSVSIGGKGRSSVSIDGSTIYVSGRSLSGVSGVEILDTTDPTQLSVKAADATISIGAGGVSVGTIQGTNIAEGQVLKTFDSVSPDSTNSNIALFVDGTISKYSPGAANSIGLSGRSFSGVSGVEIDSSFDPTQVSVKAADATISIGAGGVSVGTIQGTNIAEGQVLKTFDGVDPDSVNSNVALFVKGTISKYSPGLGSSIGLSGKELSGVSGIQIDKTTDPYKFYPVAADSTLEVTAAGIKIKDGGVGSSQIANSTVVRSLNGQQDTVTISVEDPVTISASAGTITIKVRDATSSNTGVIKPAPGPYSIDASGNLFIPSQLSHLSDLPDTEVEDGSYLRYNGSTSLWEYVSDTEYWIEGAAAYDTNSTVTQLSLKSQGLDTAYYSEMPIPVLKKCKLGKVAIAAWSNTDPGSPWVLIARTGSAETEVARKSFPIGGSEPNVITVGSWEVGDGAILNAGSSLSLICTGETTDQLYVQVRIELIKTI